MTVACSHADSKHEGPLNDIGDMPKWVEQDSDSE